LFITPVWVSGTSGASADKADRCPPFGGQLHSLTTFIR
jgi:hypothetical protein